MSRISRLVIVAIVIVGLGVLVAPTPITKRAVGETGCSAASLSGPYAMQNSGSIFGAPSAMLGTFVFDGQGKSTGSLTLNFGGDIDHFETTGTYKVNAGCTGEMTVFTPHKKSVNQYPMAHYHDMYMVLVDGGKEVLYIYGGPKASASDEPARGESLSGVMKRL